MFAMEQLKVAGKNSSYRQLSSDSNDYSNIYLIHRNGSRLIKDAIVEQLERKPEGDVLWSFSSPGMCKLCPKESDVHNKILRKSESVCLCMCVLAALPVKKTLTSVKICYCSARTTTYKNTNLHNLLFPCW